MTDAQDPTNSRIGSERIPREASPSTGWQEMGPAMGVEAGLPEYIDEHKEDLEKLAEQEYPISPFLKSLLIQYERGEI